MTKLAYIVANILIIGGFAMLCQPFFVAVYSVGFPVIVAGVVIHIIFDHVPQTDDNEQHG